MTVKRRIGNAFGAASGYDEAAHVQRKTATRLAGNIAALALPERPRILEIGCGTGLLSRALKRQGVEGRRLLTDLAPAMVARCRDWMGQSEGVHYLAMDGEELPFAPDVRFDLICSSLAFQWFDDLPAALNRLAALVAPGGHLAFATLADGSFSEWHRVYGRGDAPAYPSPEALMALAPAGFGASIDSFELFQSFASTLQFLRQLRAIGAHARRNGERPLPPGAMRRAMRAFEVQGPVARYHIACCTFSRKA